MHRHNITTARKLRRNQTNAEHKLWSMIRNRQLSGIKFRRQFPAGKYILDFYCSEHKLGIEADGGQHYEKECKKQDEVRAKELRGLGIRIVRFSDLDILNNISGVCEVIQEAIRVGKESAPHLNPLPCGERKS